MVGEGEMVTLKKIMAKSAEIKALAEELDVTNVRVFGSVARGDQSPASDVDFLVTMKPGFSLMKHARLILTLEKILNCKVDVVTEGGLKERIKKSVLEDAIAL
jgi:predicted nucleotidyltransferase